MDKRALFALLAVLIGTLLVVLLLRGPEPPGPAPAPAPPSFDLQPARILPEPTATPAGPALAIEPFPTPVDLPEAAELQRELDLYTGGIAYLAPIEDAGTRYALLQTKQAYGLQLLGVGETFAPNTVIARIDEDRLIMSNRGAQRVLPRRFKPYDAKGQYFDPDTEIDPVEYEKKLQEYKEKILPTLGRPAVIMRELERIRHAPRHRIEGGSGPGPEARLTFFAPHQDVWYTFGEMARAWGVVFDVARAVDGLGEIPEGEYTLAEALAALDRRAPTRSRLEGLIVFVEYRPRSLSPKQGGVVIDTRLRDPIERFFSPGSAAEFLLPRLAEQLNLRLDLSPQVRGPVRLDLHNTTGLEILEGMLPQVGACFYIRGDTLHVEPVGASGGGG